MVETTQRQRGTHPAVRQRAAWADNLRVVLVVGVIVAHVTIAWTGVGNWVFIETPVREPMFSVLTLLMSASLFGMAVFFFLAGLFTPSSLERKGPRRFMKDRLVRLGVPLLFFIVLLGPVVEYADPENAAWRGRFWDLAVNVVWWSWPMPPAWGPTWFLAVLLLFSGGYAALRAVRPRDGVGVVATRERRTPRGRDLMAVMGVVAVVSFLVRTEVPIGEEVGRLALGQAPAWVTGFVLGIAAAEGRWLDRFEPRTLRFARRAAAAAFVATAVAMGTTTAFGGDLELFAGGRTWQSALLALVEGCLVVTMPLWLVDVFQRRFDHGGPWRERAARASFAAFVLHQPVLVGLVLASHAVPWPPEVEYVLVATLGVVCSFAVGAAALRVPGVARVV